MLSVGTVKSHVLPNTSDKFAILCEISHYLSLYLTEMYLWSYILEYSVKKVVIEQDN